MNYQELQIVSLERPKSIVSYKRAKLNYLYYVDKVDMVRGSFLSNSNILGLDIRKKKSRPGYHKSSFTFGDGGSPS